MCTHYLSLQGTRTYRRKEIDCSPMGIFSRLPVSCFLLNCDLRRQRNLISFFPRPGCYDTNQNGRIVVSHLRHKTYRGLGSGLRLSGRSGGICIHRAVRMEGRECRGISVRECDSDQAGDWPAGGIHKAMTLFPCEIAT